jgi:hypothetical protein
MMTPQFLRSEIPVFAPQGGASRRQANIEVRTHF